MELGPPWRRFWEFVANIAFEGQRYRNDIAGSLHLRTKVALRARQIALLSNADVLRVGHVIHSPHE